MSHRTTIAALALLFSAVPLAAQTGTPRTITFDDAVRIALQQNGTLRQAVNAAALDTVAVSQQRSQFLPDVRLSTTSTGSYDRAPGVNGASQALSRTSTAMTAGVSSSLVLYNGGANSANLRAARLQQTAGASDVERTRQSVVFTVVSNYLSLVEAQEQLRVRTETQASEQAQLTQIAAFVQAGRRPIADQYQQQAAVASAQLAVVQARNAVELAKVDLIQTLQLDPRGEYDFQAPPVGTATAAVAPLDSLLNQAFARRVDLAARQTELSATAQSVRAAQASRLPTVTVSAGYNTSLNSNSALGVFDQLDQRGGGSVAVGVSLPLFDRGNTAAEVQRARIAQDNARIALENQRQQVGLEVRRGYLDLQAAQQQLTAAQAQVTAAQQSLTATDQRYRAGVGTLVELTQARAVLAQAQSQLVSARYNLVFQREVVNYSIGDLDPDSVAIR